MNISKQITLTILIVTMIAGLASCGGVSSKESDPFQETDALVEKYMGALIEGKTGEAIAYEYKGTSISEDAADESASAGAADLRPRYWIDSVKDYVIKEKEKVSDSLFVYTMLLASSENLDLYRKLYFFVARIDGALYIADSPYVIPYELKDGFDASKYTFDDPNMNYAPPDAQG